MSDETNLLQRAQEHNPIALGEIYDRYAARIYGYIYARVGHRETVEDMTAEVFLRMLEALNKDRFARLSLSAWLYRIAHNLVVDYYRKRRPTLVPLESTIRAPDTPVEIVEEGRLRERVRHALVYLTSDQQQVIVLRFGQGMKAREVAQVLGKSEDAVRKLQRRALASLKRILEKKR